MEKRTKAINGRSVRYYEGGTGRPLLLLHGAGGTAKIWHRQSDRFSGSFRVVAPDLPGFGGSDDDLEIKSVRDYARSISDFLSSINIEKASVLGSSMGGWAALWLAADYPSRVDRLALVSPAGLHRPDEPPMPVDEVLREIENYYKSASKGVMSRKVLDEMEKAITTIKRIDRAGGFVPDIEERLAEIKAETLVIWGTEDRIIPPAYAEIFGAAMPDAKIKMMEGAGHLPYVERAEEFNEIILEFLGPHPLPLSHRARG